MSSTEAGKCLGSEWIGRLAAKDRASEGREPEEDVDVREELRWSQDSFVSYLAIVLSDKSKWDSTWRGLRTRDSRSKRF